MDTTTLQNQILELQKQLEDATKLKAKKEKRKEYMREYMKKKYHANLDQEREHTRNRQHKHYHNIKKPQKKAARVYEYLEDLKTMSPEYLEEIKLVIAN